MILQTYRLSLSSFFEGEKMLNFFRQSKFQGQLTKVLANAKVDGQRLGQKSKSILDMMQFDTKVHIKEMLRFFAMFGFISNSMFAFVS